VWPPYLPPSATAIAPANAPGMSARSSFMGDFLRAICTGFIEPF